MTPASLSLLVGSVAFVCYALAVPLMLRAVRGVAPVTVFVGSAVGIHVLQILAMIVIGRSTELPVPYWHGAAVFGAGAIGYLFVFSAVYKSISLRMLAMLIRDKGRVTAVDALTGAITVPEFEQRAKILLEGRFAAASAGASYVITAEGRAMAERIIGLQRAFGVAQSGLY